jgi:hypothetical protein
VKKIFFLLITLFLLPHCNKKATVKTDKNKYSLFKGGNIPPKSTTITTETKTAPITPKATNNNNEELDFEVKNDTGKTIFATCFSYIQKEPFTHWRWDKSPVYKIEHGKTAIINIDTIPDKQNQKSVYAYLAIFDDEKKARASIYELVDDTKKIDLNKLYNLIGKTVTIKVERYGFKKELLDFAIVDQIKEREEVQPELDFVVENGNGKTIFVTVFTYQIKDDIRSVWNYDKSAVYKLKPGEQVVIDIDTIDSERNRKYMSGFLAVFDEHEEKLARESTYELLPSKYKIPLGRLSHLEGEKVVIEVEQYGAVGELTEFDIRPAQSPLEPKYSSGEK